jgi:hypothetical protein
MDAIAARNGISPEGLKATFKILGEKPSICGKVFADRGFKVDFLVQAHGSDFQLQQNVSGVFHYSC